MKQGSGVPYSYPLAGIAAFVRGTVTGSLAVAWEKPALRFGGLPARGSKPLPAIMKSGQQR
jgi:hypothetical protein